MQRPQLRARIGSEAFGQRAAGLLVGGEGVGAPARGAQGADQQGVQRLVVRPVRGELPQFRYDVGGPAEQQVRLDACADGLGAPGVGARGGAAVGQVGEGGAAPEGQRVTQDARGRLRVAAVQGRPALAREPLEAVQVDFVGGDRKAVAARVRGDGVLADRSAQAADEGLERRGGVGRRFAGQTSSIRAPAVTARPACSARAVSRARSRRPLTGRGAPWSSYASVAPRIRYRTGSFSPHGRERARGLPARRAPGPSAGTAGAGRGRPPREKTGGA
ncbi:hypothetical protein SALBM135S_00895 [Streptomyces alboniger]